MHEIVGLSPFMMRFYSKITGRSMTAPTMLNVKLSKKQTFWQTETARKGCFCASAQLSLSDSHVAVLWPAPRNDMRYTELPPKLPLSLRGQCAHWPWQSKTDFLLHLFFRFPRAQAPSEWQWSLSGCLPNIHCHCEDPERRWRGRGNPRPWNPR